mmetsp:Transcript_11481/g.12329  ORF Transcript_11481/g.12329 Transcript_11481/m.12329 type:complete len:228 (-) Transcript_11481:1752-2435(-)
MYSCLHSHSRPADSHPGFFCICCSPTDTSFFHTHCYSHSSAAISAVSLLTHTHTSPVMEHYSFDIVSINGSMTFGMFVCLSVYQSPTRIRASSFFFFVERCCETTTLMVHTVRRRERGSTTTASSHHYSQMCVCLYICTAPPDTRCASERYTNHPTVTPHLGLSHASDLPTNPYCSGTWIIICCYSYTVVPTVSNRQDHQYRYLMSHDHYLLIYIQYICTIYYMIHK